MSWIHADDLVEMIVFSLQQPEVFGAVNATAPNPVRNAEFATALGAAVHRPAVVRTPEFALKIVLGEGASAVMASERVLPRAAERAGFSFRYPEINEALRATLTASKPDTNR